MRDETSIDLAPLTILAGANSSGKSAFMQPLLLLKQTLEAAVDPGPLLLNGANAKFDNANEMFWHAPGESATTMSVTYFDADYERAGVSFCRSKSGVDVQSMTYGPQWLTSQKECPDPIVISTGSSSKELMPYVDQELVELFGRARTGRTQPQLSVARNRCFLDVVLEVDEHLHLPIPKPGNFLLRNLAANMIHLPGLRDNPTRFYPVTNSSDRFLGPFHPYTASIIASWSETKDVRLRALNDQLIELGLTWKVESRRYDDTKVSVKVGRLPRAQRGGSRDLVSLADVGLGVSQTLPVLTALLAARAGQVVYLEQPELHLHPRAQVALGNQLVRAAALGVIVVCETHSHLLIRAIQTAVARGDLASNWVALNWFARDSDGVTRTRSSQIGSDGSFGDWPLDFADVEIESERAYLMSGFSSR